MHACAAAGSAHNDQRQLLLGRTLDESREALANDRPHAAHKESRVSKAEGDATRADHAGARDGGVREPGQALFDAELLDYDPQTGRCVQRFYRRPT